MFMKSFPVLGIFTVILCVTVLSCGGDDGSGNPDFVPVYKDYTSALNGGNKFLAEDRTEQAINAFTQATKLDGGNPEGFFQLGVALAERERLEEEKVRLNDTGKARSGEVQKVLASRVAFERAVVLYNEITQKDSKNHSAFFNLGRALNRLDRDSEAEEAYREALKISPANNEYRIKLGETLMKLAKWGEAVAELRKAAEADPENFDLAEKIESAELSRKRLAFIPTPSPSPSPEETPVN
jgi:Flp pilus assembly protein TadD